MTLQAHRLRLLSMLLRFRFLLKAIKNLATTSSNEHLEPNQWYPHRFGRNVFKVCMEYFFWILFAVKNLIVRVCLKTSTANFNQMSGPPFDRLSFLLPVLGFMLPSLLLPFIRVTVSPLQLPVVKPSFLSNHTLTLSALLLTYSQNMLIAMSLSHRPRISTRSP